MEKRWEREVAPKVFSVIVKSQLSDVQMFHDYDIAFLIMFTCSALCVIENALCAHTAPYICAIICN